MHGPSLPQRKDALRSEKLMHCKKRILHCFSSCTPNTRCDGTGAAKLTAAEACCARKYRHFGEQKQRCCRRSLPHASCAAPGAIQVAAAKACCGTHQLSRWLPENKAMNELYLERFVNIATGQVIMDGNARWARRRGLPVSAGHARGVEALCGVIQACCEWGIPALTVRQPCSTLN